MFLWSILVGVAVFWMSRWAYHSMIRTILWTVPSVYLAAILTGLILGLMDCIARGTDTTYFYGGVFATIWVMSKLSPFLLLYPLAFVTHIWVRAGKDINPGPSEIRNAI
jgi:hypothetical protein